MFGKLKRKLGKLVGGIGVLGLIGVGIALLFLFLAIVPFLFMLCWNAFMSPVFHLPQIDFWMSLAAVILIGFFGSIFHK